LNETSLFIFREGVFYGQCSEICGVGHANMPIVIEAVDSNQYAAWLIEKI
jgi:heme/copper-type cytochrome/quinol oxidase subunit 2